LDATVGSLWQEMRETGEFPVDAGVDALRAWAFVIARMHDKSYQTQTTLMRRPVLVGEALLHVGFNAQDYERLFAST
jgi:arsenate reductase-like glutaredoxin family protein